MYYIHIKKGVQLPGFAIRSLSGSTKLFTNNSFDGKYYLLYFWSIFNRASLDEIVRLDKAFRRYEGKRFALLTVSVDSSARDVRRFIHNHKLKTLTSEAIEEKGFHSRLCKDFEIYSVPKPILVNPAGKIVAVGWDLRGRKLYKTLERYINR